MPTLSAATFLPDTVVKSTPVPAFFEPGALPLPLPVLTNETDLFYNRSHPHTVLAEEELLRSPEPGPLRSRETSLPKPNLPKPNLPKPNLPKPRPYSKVTSPTPKDTSDSDDASDTESEVSDSSSASCSDSGKIPKPDGEPGRPGRGGYNLIDALDWNPKAFKRLKNYIHTLVNNHLDLTKSYSRQNLVLLQLVRNKATERFPELNSYVGGWPALDLVKMRLKYTSSAARRKVQQMALGNSIEPKPKPKKQQKTARHP
ncbi:hypothetical protein BD779DRAFT_1675566 [Infundibulicybe gibba]|nr:hypothetical protein BD779DRAFT_1675566 [Infundibulicybe gibba]